MAEFTFVDPFGDAAFPYLVIDDEIVEALELNNLSIISARAQHGEMYVEIEGYTDAGGDMIHTLHLPKDGRFERAAWYKAFHDMYMDFDAFEEAVKWCDSTGKPVKTPFDNGSDLYEDIKAYELDVLAPTDGLLAGLCWNELKEGADV